MVDIVDNGGDVISRRSGDDHLFRPGLQVGGSLLSAGVEAGAFQHHIHPQFPPGEFAGVGFGVDGNGVSINQDGAVVVGHLVCQGIGALGGVILEQVSQHSGGSQVIDGHDVEQLSAKHLAEGQAADAAEAVDCNAHGHSCKTS